MEIDVKKFLEMCEKTKEIAFYDIETNGLRADYGRMLVATVKPFAGKPVTFKVSEKGSDRSLVADLRDELESYSIIVGYYSRGFDMPFLRSKLLKYNMKDIESPLHLDLYFTLKPKMLTSTRSQAHLLNWLGTPQQKMSVSADVWSRAMSSNPERHISTLIKRCESDVAGLEGLYNRTKHLIGELKR